jgi:hypothetical protein
MKARALKPNQYDKLLASIFKRKWTLSMAEVPFTKDEVIDVANELGLRLKNLADVIYTYRSRRPMPKEILKTGNWVIAARDQVYTPSSRFEAKRRLRFPIR